jgi:hypothetical protein
MNDNIYSLEKKSIDRIILINVITIAALTIFFDILIIISIETKGVNFLYVGLSALVLNLLILLVFAIISFSKSRIEAGKALLKSILYSILTYGAIQLIFLYI